MCPQKLLKGVCFTGVGAGGWGGGGRRAQREQSGLQAAWDAVGALKILWWHSGDCYQRMERKQTWSGRVC